MFANDLLQANASNANPYRYTCHLRYVVKDILYM